MSNDAVRAALFALRRRVVEAIERSERPAQVPFPYTHDHDDGSMSLQWRLPDRRVALIVDPDPAESSWHAVSSAGRMDCGPLDSADLDAIIDFVLAAP